MTCFPLQVVFRKRALDEVVWYALDMISGGSRELHLSIKKLPSRVNVPRLYRSKNLIIYNQKNRIAQKERFFVCSKGLNGVLLGV